MKKRTIGFIIVSMGLALLGVVAMQLYFLRQSYKMQSEEFNRSVNEALSSVVNKVAKQDAISFLTAKTKVRPFNGTTTITRISINGNALGPDDSVKIKKARSKRERKLAILRDSLKRMIMHKKQDDEVAALMQHGTLNLRIRIEEFTDEFGNVQGRMIPEVVKGPPQPVKRRIYKYDTLRGTYIDPQFGPQVITVANLNPLWVQQQQRLQKEKQLKQIKKMLETDSLQNLPRSSQSKANVIASLTEEYRKSGEPLAKRLNSFWIDSLLRFELQNRGIMLPFSYEVSTANSDSLIFSSAMDVQGKKPEFIEANTYQKAIFGNEVINDPGKIKVYFPDR